MPKKQKTSLSQFITALVLAVGLALIWYFDGDRSSSLPVASEEGVRCVHVVDGDTIDIRRPGGDKVRVRIMGIDCPETHNVEKRLRLARQLGVSERALEKVGRDASQFTRSALSGKTVSLLNPGKGSMYDPYQRLLAYVELDGVDHGAELLRRGLAQSRREPHPRKESYWTLEKKARKSGVGIHGLAQE